MLKYASGVIFLLLLHSQCIIGLADIAEDDWVEPHIWGHLSDWEVNAGASQDEVCSKCNKFQNDAISTSSSQNDAVALVYFKKYIITLFNRKRLQYDESALLYKRTLSFTLLPSQLDELEKLNDPRDLDIVLSKIFANAQTPSRYGGCDSAEGGMSVRALVMDIFRDFVQLLKVSEIQFAAVVIIAIALGWFVHHRYRLSVLVIVLGGILVFGYFHTYLECNRKIEVDQMLEVIAVHEAANKEPDYTWYGRLKNYLFPGETPAEIQKAKLKSASKLNLAFCRPDHVLLIYANELFVKQLEFFIEKCSATIQTLKNGLSFPFNYIASLAMLVMIAYILKLTFKYILSPKAWASLVHKPTYVAKTQAAHAQIAGGAAADADTVHDRLTGENLKMLLNVIQNTTNSKQQQQPAVSGVQEVLEQLEAPPIKASRNSDSNDSSIDETKHGANNNQSNSSGKETSFN